MSTRIITSTSQAAGYLSHTYHWPLDRCERLLDITRELASPVARPTDAGIVTVTWTGGSSYTVVDRHR